MSKATKSHKVAIPTKSNVQTQSNRLLMRTSPRTPNHQPHHLLLEDQPKKAKDANEEYPGRSAVPSLELSWAYFSSILPKAPDDSESIVYRHWKQ